MTREPSLGRLREFHSADSILPVPTIARGQLLRPYPQFGNVRNRQASGARSRYHALIAQLEKRLSHGW
jgi:hypothetical protein